MNFFSSLWNTFKNDKLLQKIIKNTSYLLSSNVASMGLALLQSILAGRLLGVEGFGVIATITAFASMINRLFSFRMNELVVKYFGEATLQNMRERAAAVVKAAALGETISSILSFIVILLLAPFAAVRLASNADTSNLFALYGIMVLVNFATETSTGVLQVRNKYGSQAILNLVSSIMTASIIVWAFFVQKGLMEVMLAYLVGKFVLGLGTIALGWHEMQKEYGRGWLQTSFANLPPFKELFGFAFSTNISSTIIMLVRDNEALWIAWFLNPVAVGYAKTALAFINLVQIPITPFIATTYPEINAAVTNKDWTLLRR
jgi:O-antigen/teichoic acid export membrane protein